MNVIRCDWCENTYDGDVHTSCPHCLAPRPVCEARVERRRSECVFYSDDKPYWLSSDGYLYDPNRLVDYVDRGVLSLNEARDMLSAHGVDVS